MKDGTKLGGRGMKDKAMERGGGKLENLRNKKKSPKSTLLADNARGLTTTKQTKPRPVASAAPHPITPVYLLHPQIRSYVIDILILKKVSLFCSNLCPSDDILGDKLLLPEAVYKTFGGRTQDPHKRLSDGAVVIEPWGGGGGG